MSVIDRALWVIERNSNQALSLVGTGPLIPRRSHACSKPTVGVRCRLEGTVAISRRGPLSSLSKRRRPVDMHGQTAEGIRTDLTSRCSSGSRRSVLRNQELLAVG